LFYFYKVLNFTLWCATLLFEGGNVIISYQVLLVPIQQYLLLRWTKQGCIIVVTKFNKSAYQIIKFILCGILHYSQYFACLFYRKNLYGIGIYYYYYYYYYLHTIIIYCTPTVIRSLHRFSECIF